ncbi:MAG: polysaccharide deacetylase family protein [Blastocatellia bacterium]
MKKLCLLLLPLLAAVYPGAPAQTFKWPAGKRAALSLTFDDARASQVTGGTALLDRHGIRATFYVVPSAVAPQLAGWKQAVASGHEIANHSLNHPCSGNFPWARKKAIEEYTLEKMRQEMLDTNQRIKDMLGVTAESFAYPCGQTWVGRGVDTRSYVPLAAALFSSARGWLDEAPNDPVYCDFAQLTGMESDGKDFEQILPLLEKAKTDGHWLVLAGHEMGRDGAQTTRLAMLEKLAAYVNAPDSGVWTAPVATVAKYVRQQRGW